MADCTQFLFNRVLADNGWHNTNPQGLIGRDEFLHECGGFATNMMVYNLDAERYLDFLCHDCSASLMVDIKRLVNVIHSVAFQIIPAASVKLPFDEPKGMSV